MRLILLFILGHFIMSAAVAETLSGPIKVLDAASLRIGQTVVTLNAIAAPQPDDRCPLRSVTIRCGRIATTALMDLTAGARVKCKTHGKPNAKGVYVATCKANGYDLSKGMIYTGWARPGKGAPAQYRKVEASAKKRGRGLWRGEFPDAVNEAAANR